MKMSVLEWLHRNPGVHDIAVIARATGFNQKVVDRALTYHVRVGQAVRVGEPHDIPRYRSADMEIERSAGRLLRKRGNARVRA
jgi:hypothetical protein